MNIVEYNRQAWDGYVEKKDRWTVPVSSQDIDEARKGNWSIVLTPRKGVPRNWFPELKGLKILGLASGGGQQCPILAAAGAEVTVFDNSPGQLHQDQKLSDEFQLNIRTVQGDMKDLSVFPDASFDLVFNPCSVTFVEDVKPVWKECYRVLKPGGILMAGVFNPIALQLDEETLQLIYQQPYSDTGSLPPEKLDHLIKNNDPLIFGHSLTDLIAAQLEAGFLLSHFFEDYWGENHKMDAFFPSFLATRAIKSV